MAGRPPPHRGRRGHRLCLPRVAGRDRWAPCLESPARPLGTAAVPGAACHRRDDAACQLDPFRCRERERLRLLGRCAAQLAGLDGGRAAAVRAGAGWLPSASGTRGASEAAGVAGASSDRASCGSDHRPLAPGGCLLREPGRLDSRRFAHSPARVRRPRQRPACAGTRCSRGATGELGFRPRSHESGVTSPEVRRASRDRTGS